MEPPKEKEEEEEREISIMDLFADVWGKTVAFVQRNAHLVGDDVIAEKLCKGIDRAPELALVGLSGGLTSEIIKEILEKDDEKLLERIGAIVPLPAFDLPEEVREEAYVLIELIILILRDINHKE